VLQHIISISGGYIGKYRVRGAFSRSSNARNRFLA
jgi:hypothetical protein